MYFVYIIETEDGTYYTGQTNDLQRRFSEHVSGSPKGAAYLRAHKPKYLVYLEECDDRGNATRREKQIQNNRSLKLHLVGSGFRRDLREVIESERSYRS
ncbi:MAG: GIY-YIG nuclease family protein [Candidatus Thorarchaeota archaeon]|nr:GIY-YIG nuclease family protein [Candidatus Thorarchaeota archaeon]